MISLYLDQELRPLAQENLKHHLASCSTCRSYWEKMNQIQQEMASWPGINLSPEELQAARAKILKQISLFEVNSAQIPKKDFWLLIKRKWQWAIPILLIMICSLLLFQWVKKSEMMAEIEGISFPEDYYFLNENNENLLIAFNHFLEQAMAEFALSEIDYSFLLDYFYLTIEELKEEEKEGLLNLLSKDLKENSW